MLKAVLCMEPGKVSPMRHHWNRDPSEVREEQSRDPGA